MLYTFSQADYSEAELQRYLSAITAQDAIVFWQDGVLLPFKHAELWSQLDATCYALEIDLQARNLICHMEKVRSISLPDFVALSERYFPQLAL
ncbi:MAG: DsrH/TusB family sulfur metabolism protein [[Pasteurella] mairii]|uniref:tRNA 2-thiouridine synthesizing protein B n=1 Tax=[Pasteurella] mairii TaxID=757 RepID=A0A379B7W1_9PAST|nr:DsrH/TusB family sulfur metabolism protein [[Pasteurella] mairii]SUB34634.1 tRNA 2-thiouridine synthesizing protein B [[Pasteurella] mairii]